MTQTQASSAGIWAEPKPTAVLVLADGTVLEGFGLGAAGHAVGEVCFNTAMTGYEEVLTDPSYAGQIITFTFPHIGNVGVNEEDIESLNLAARPGACGVILHTAITQPSNYRAKRHLDDWLRSRDIVGLAGIDTRALTAMIRQNGYANAVIAHAPDGKFDLDALKKQAREWPGLIGMDLVPQVTSGQRFTWNETPWTWGEGFGRQENYEFHVVALDYGIKRNILRQLAGNGCKVTVVPAQTSAEDILALKPDGIFLSNGPGDPAATGEYAVPVLRKLIDSGTPTFGICLGHQMLGLAVGGKTVKMHQGHHGANHPVKDLTTGKVEITSMNHGFALDGKSLPQNAVETHVSLFDGSNCGMALKDKPVFSVQYHPEASPGPRDSHYLFGRFVDMMRRRKGKWLSMPASPLTLMFPDDGSVPNNPALPVLLYRGAIDVAATHDPESEVGRVFVANGWGRDLWRDGIYPYTHYHSMIHEALGIARGSARVRLGGTQGKDVELAAGDVAVLPAGTGHQRLSSSADLRVIGGYPPEGIFNLCRGSKAERDQALHTIPLVPAPASDPVHGVAGPLVSLWRSATQDRYR